MTTPDETPPSGAPAPAAGAGRRDAFRGPLPAYDDDTLARALPEEPGGARGAVWFRLTEEDFLVDEVPAYLPSGAGEHLYLHVEKRGLSTPELIRRLCGTYNLSEVDVGIAGQKDAHGVTRQWVSVPARVVEPALERMAELGPVRVLEHGRHGNKLRLGHLRGNRFTIRMSGDVDAAALERRAALLAPGVPNYFGAQRFGHSSQTLRDAERFVQRRRPAKTRREKFWVSALQSSLFNAWLNDRVLDGTWRVPLLGDVLLKSENGAPFTCRDVALEAPRVSAGETSPSGPLVGKRMRPAEGDAATQESRSWQRLGVDLDALLEHPAFGLGDRRTAVLMATDLAARAVEETGQVEVTFTLPKGAYATVLLREWVGASLKDPVFDADVPGENLHVAP